MPKRFTDTEKWKKPFIRGLEGAYKLLWFYILDDCDHAGIWQVDFEVARIRIGEQVDKETAKKLFGDRVIEFAPFKWFLPDFIFFQYGELSEKNRMHKSVIDILTKNNLGASKALPRGQGTIQGQGNGQGERQEQGGDKIEDKLKGAFDEIYLDQQKIKWPHLDFLFEFRAFCEKVRGSPEHYRKHDTGGLRLAFQSQLRNAKPKVNGHRKGKETPAELAAAFAERVVQDAKRGEFQGDK